MDSETLMTLAADKAAKEVSLEGLEFLFRPATMFELLVRIDLEGMERKVNEWFFDMSPDALPHRFRGQYLGVMGEVFKRERFYRLVRSKYDSTVQ
jgi:hypothetical protein